jgi:hypothetical protein
MFFKEETNHPVFRSLNASFGPILNLHPFFLLSMETPFEYLETALKEDIDKVLLCILLIFHLCPYLFGSIVCFFQH